MFLTSNPSIAEHAKWCADNYPTITNSVEAMTKTWDSSLESFAELDNLIAKGQTDIGSSSNVSQLYQSISYTYLDKREQFDKESALNSVLAQLAIDGAKRCFLVDVTKAISESKKRLNISEVGYPKFWKNCHDDFSGGKINDNIVCPMNICAGYAFPRMSYTYSVPTENYLSSMGRANVDKEVVSQVLDVFNFCTCIGDDLCCDDTKVSYILAEEEFEEMCSKVGRIVSSKRYIGVYRLLMKVAMTDYDYRGVDMSNVKKNRSMLIALLYKANKKLFLDCISDELSVC